MSRFVEQQKQYMPDAEFEEAKERLRKPLPPKERLDVSKLDVEKLAPEQQQIFERYVRGNSDPSETQILADLIREKLHAGCDHD